MSNVVLPTDNEQRINGIHAFFPKTYIPIYFLALQRSLISFVSLRHQP